MPAEAAAKPHGNMPDVYRFTLPDGYWFDASFKRTSVAWSKDPWGCFLGRRRWFAESLMSLLGAEAALLGKDMPDGSVVPMPPKKAKKRRKKRRSG